MARRKKNREDESIVGVLILIALGSLGFVKDHWKWFALGTAILLLVLLTVLLIRRRNRKPAPKKAVAEMNGFEYEEYVAARMKEAGYAKVRVTEKTGDYGADIIAVDPKGKKIAVQCKHYKSNVGISAIQEIHAARDYYGTDLAAVVTTAQFTDAAKKLAAKNSVLLFPAFKDHSSF